MERAIAIIIKQGGLEEASVYADGYLAQAKAYISQFSFSAKSCCNTNIVGNVIIPWAKSLPAGLPNFLAQGAEVTVISPQLHQELSAMQSQFVWMAS